MVRVLHALTTLAPAERDTIKPAYWRPVARFLQKYPTWLFDTDQTAYGVPLQDNPLLLEKRLLDPRGAQAKAIRNASVEQHFLPAPLQDPNAPLSQRMTAAVQAYWQVMGEFPEQLHTGEWSTQLQSLLTPPLQVRLTQSASAAAEADAPLLDRLNWFMGWHAHRLHRGSPNSQDWDTVWGHLRDHHQTTETSLPPPLLQVIAPLFQLDRVGTIQVSNWVSQWKKDIEAGMKEPPWTWLPKVGIPVSSDWQAALTQEAMNSPAYPVLAAQVRQAQQQDQAPDRSRRRLRS